MARREMPVWGWGDPDRSRELPATVEAVLEERFGTLRSDSGRVPLEHFDAPPPRMPASTREEIVSCVGAANCDDSTAARISRAAGKSYPDLVRMRAGSPSGLPDLVASPGTVDEVESLLQCCAQSATAVVPFGGGTSVTGGLAPLADGDGGVLVVDLSRMSGVESIDETSMIATFLAGTSGPEVERALSGHGLTLGHFPQSWIHGTVGGFVATRSSGQASTGYGRIDSNVLGLVLVTPTGRITLPPMPGTAAGPGLRQMIVGSEGTLGIITSVDLQLRRSPERILDRAWLVDGFDRGCNLLRRLEQDGCAPTVARLSDEPETETTLALAAGSRAGRLLGRYARARADSPCLLVFSHEGDREAVEARSAEATAILRSGGALDLGRAPGRAWRHGRYDGPYLRDSLMDRGLMVDTLETASTWHNLGRLHSSVSAAIRDAVARDGVEPIVMCHVSHLYQGGASLYFTFIAKPDSDDPEAMIDEWREVKRAAGDAIVGGGGTISHHHAVGLDHRDWMPAEVGVNGLRALAAVKRELDPAGVMNPGKLLPPVAGA